MVIETLVASHAVGKGAEPDAVFAILKAANAATAKYGKGQVINASIGALYTEEEKFATLPTVEAYFRSIPAEELMNYAPISGLPEFLEAAIADTFQGFQPPHTYARAIATPGGTGGVRHAIYNYVEQGEKVLVPDWAWGPYHTIAAEHLRGTETYEMFDRDFHFNFDAFTEKAEGLLKTQNNFLAIFNTPAHNPTGYSLTVEEWRQILDLCKAWAANEQKKIILLLDMAYLDYAGDVEETRQFMRLFEALPANVLILIAYSMSKAYLIYGMRSGALIALSSSPEVAQEFERISAFSNRGVWSNGTRGAQRLLADLAKDPVLRSKVTAERNVYRDLLKQRSAILLEEARAVDLQLMPYQSGFFITVPTAQPRQLVEKLMSENLFTVPLKKGIRLAICAVPTYKVPGMAQKIKAALST
ncbi:MAG TPA: aminotransferase class I/II-fold pyridoxal phosphate-dependent enzyme [Peptococcaceae bacterium]|jgi:aromatic-amino-acid transaminase|nr:aminotransferase class I/II-fold pyridoxal phosphate-dependent enzyme [Clostridia bacterium]HOB81453.1 aminotransferase class I/II-fold pyridoxal phosphate-dependent enzyme [Peptococcaceae bacterium]HPZ72193.1 aminotransferase class I/II-fold pyridoxal phosphate-dependent enzyme [Peptococcaceae bacterium]HQD53504.1 aminotransferase class I/II-fold pyridoxal phosphate-dependent enzyme [Peptococcaceae bacterium]